MNVINNTRVAVNKFLVGAADNLNSLYTMRGFDLIVKLSLSILKATGAKTFDGMKLDFTLQKEVSYGTGIFEVAGEWVDAEHHIGNPDKGNRLKEGARWSLLFGSIFSFASLLEKCSFISLKAINQLAEKIGNTPIPRSKGSLLLERMGFEPGSRSTFNQIPLVGALLNRPRELFVALAAFFEVVDWLRNSYRYWDNNFAVYRDGYERDYRKHWSASPTLKVISSAAKISVFMLKGNPIVMALELIANSTALARYIWDERKKRMA